jgi:microcystin-dependent protein
MATPYLGQIEAFAFGFAPKGWAICAGQLLPINQYQALFSLLGTTFGGNGINTFALPNLQGRVGIGSGDGAGLTPRTLGEEGGEEAHTLAQSEFPVHGHQLNAAANGTTGGTNVPSTGVMLASGYAAETGSPAVNVYGSGTTIPMGSLAAAGGGQPHENRMPFLVLNYCIAMQGIFPSRN